MAALIPITGVASNYRVPGGYAEILFAQGPSNAGAGTRSVCLVMPITSAGTYTVNTRYRVRNEAEVKAGAGAGSPLHRAARAFLRANKTTELYVVPYAASSGGGAASATATVTVAITTITAGGTIDLAIAGEEFTTAFSTSDTATTIAAKIVEQVNARDWLPVTASNSLGVVTLTAKIAGASQGTAAITVIRVRVDGLSTGRGVTVTSTGNVGSATAGADGATTELVNFTAALATLDSVRHYYMGQSIGTPGSAALSTHIALKSEPLSGLRSVGCLAFTGTLADATTAAVARNYERVQLVWQAASEHDYAELVGSVLAVRSKRESTDSAFNFDGYRGQDWLIKPAKAVAHWPDLPDQNDAINEGITCIASDNAGSYIVMSVNTRSKNAAGTVDDFRATETHRVSVADELVDEMLAQYANQYGSAKLRSDELLPSGLPNPNQRIPRGVVTPSVFKPWIRDLIAEYYDGGKLQNLDAMLSSLNVLRSTDNSGRLECGFDINVIDHLHQATFRVAETSAG